MAILLENYIHYTYEHRENANAINQMTFTKDMIWNKYLQRYNDIRKERKLNEISENQMFELMKDISSEGMIGGQLLSDLQQNSGFWLQQRADSLASLSKITTGAGLLHGDIDTASENLQKINEMLNTLINFLATNERPIVISKLLNSANAAGVIVDPSVLSWVQNTNPKSLIAIEDNNSIGSSIDSSVDTLQTQISMLTEVINGQEISAKDYNTLINKIAGAFSNIGGILFQDAGIYGFNVAHGHTRNEFKSLHDFIENLESVNFKEDAFFRETGESLAEGKQIKPDIAGYYTKESAVYEVSGSMKLRQAKKVQLGRAVSLGSLQGKNGTTPTIEQLFRAAQEINPAAAAGEIEVLAGLANTYKNSNGVITGRWVAFTQANASTELGALEKAFEEIKKYGAAQTLFNQMFGKGGLADNGDMNLAQFFWVNNKIVTAQQIYNHLGSTILNSINSSDAIEIKFPIKFNTIHENLRAIGTKYRKKPESLLKRSGEQHEELDRMLQKKVGISIKSFMNLLTNI